MTAIEIGPDDPRADDVAALLRAHLAHANEMSPAEHVHALDIDGLCQPDMRFFAARRSGELLAVGALKVLDDEHYEIKSMHTAEAARGQGIGRLMVERLLAVALDAGAERVSLETGTMEGMAPARRLYHRLGFVDCAPFGAYRANEFGVCMTIQLVPEPPAT